MSVGIALALFWGGFTVAIVMGMAGGLTRFPRRERVYPRCAQCGAKIQDRESDGKGGTRLRRLCDSCKAECKRSPAAPPGWPSEDD